MKIKTKRTRRTQNIQMATDTKTTVSTELDTVLCWEQELNRITASGYDPIIGALTCLRDITTKQYYGALLFDLEKVMIQHIQRLEPIEQHVFRDKIKTLEPEVKCDLLATTKNMKWVGRHTCGISSYNWIVWTTSEWTLIGWYRLQPTL